jgi:hypothetical protein
MSVELEEFAPGRWRVRKDRLFAPVSDLPCPQIISDHMPPTEQVDGVFYESKSAFRAVGKANGLIEIGNEKLPPVTRSTKSPVVQKQRRDTIARTIAEYRAMSHEEAAVQARKARTGRP